MSDKKYNDRLAGYVEVKDRIALFYAAHGDAAQAETLLRDPVRVEVAATPGNAPAIVQRVIEVDPSRRTQLLRHLFKDNGWDRVLVFVATKYAAEHVATKLYARGVYATAFRGGLSQGARSEVPRTTLLKALIDDTDLHATHLLDAGKLCDEVRIKLA